MTYVGNGVTVASTVVGERGRRRDIPASAAVGRLGVDDDIAVCLSQLGILSALVVGRSSATAVVNGDDDGGLGGELVGNVDVHLDARGVGTEVGDLLEGGTLDDLGSAREGGAEGQKAGGDGRELHCRRLGWIGLSERRTCRWMMVRREGTGVFLLSRTSST